MRFLIFLSKDVGLLVLWMMTIVSGLWAEAARGEPFTPRDDTQVLERLLRAPGGPQEREIRRLRRALAQDPNNLAMAIPLTRCYLEIGRAEADPRYYGYAEAALLPWWDQKQPPVEVLVLRAILRQARHDFDGALKDLSLALRIHPYHAQAWLTRAR